MARLARTYVYVLFLIQLLIFGVCLLHISTWIRGFQLRGQSGQAVLLAAFLACFPTALFARDWNIWRNEFKSCPLWVRVLTLTCVLYAIAITLGQMVLFPIAPDPNGFFILSAIMLAVDSVSLCVLYSVLWRSPLRESELVKRSRLSFVVAVACIALFVADRAVPLQHTIR